MSATRVKPFFKWAGGKYTCLGKLLASFPHAGRLIEPFTGSGAIFANTQYNHYLLAEANPDLVNFYNRLKIEGDRLITLCEKYFVPENNHEQNYYYLRTRFNSLDETEIERSAIFLYLNRHGYNGLCRYNQKGGYNVPFGRYRKPYFPKRELQHFHNKSQHAEFILSDFRQTFTLAEPGDLIYCDPPYVPLSSTAFFASYTRNKFKEEDQIALAQLAKESASRGITVIISNHDTIFTREHYKDAQLDSFLVNRNISCNGKKRSAVAELIAIFR